MGDLGATTTPKSLWPVCSAAGQLLLAWGALLAAGSALGHVVPSTLHGWDTSAVNTLRGSPTGALTDIARAITWLGSPVWLDLVFAIALLALLLRRALRDVLLLVLASPGTVLMVQLIKAAVARHRPPGPHLTAAEGLSWPSGHASSSAALYGALLLLAIGHPSTNAKRARLAQIATATLLALIGLSRVYLGVHYVSDVLAAWLLVAAWLTALWHTLLRPRRAGLNRRPPAQSPGC